MTGIPTSRPAASIRRVVSRVGIALLLVVLAIGAAAASSDAAGPTITVESTSSTPTSVTRGYNALYTITFRNGSTAAQHVTISDPAVGQSLPAGTKFVSAKTDVGSCPAVTTSTTSVTCDIG